MQTIPEARRTDGGAAARPAARRRLRVPFRGDRASRPPCPAAGIKPASGARRRFERNAGATGRPAVAPLPTQPPRGQRLRTAAGLSLAVLAPIAAGLALLVVAFDGAAAGLVAVTVLALAGVALATLLARDA